MVSSQLQVLGKLRAPLVIVLVFLFAFNQVTSARSISDPDTSNFQLLLPPFLRRSDIYIDPGNAREYLAGSHVRKKRSDDQVGIGKFELIKGKFWIYKKKVNWKDAFCSCADDGRSLAVFPDKQLARKVIDALFQIKASADLSPDTSYWIGLHDQGQDGKWEWVSGTNNLLSYNRFWQKGQPDHLGEHANGRPQHCVQLSSPCFSKSTPAKFFTHRFDDVECDVPLYFICEESPPSALPKSIGTCPPSSNRQGKIDFGIQQNTAEQQETSMKQQTGKLGETGEQDGSRKQSQMTASGNANFSTNLSANQEMSEKSSKETTRKPKKKSSWDDYDQVEESSNNQSNSHTNSSKTWEEQVEYEDDAEKKKKKKAKKNPKSKPKKKGGKKKSSWEDLEDFEETSHHQTASNNSHSNNQSTWEEEIEYEEDEKDGKKKKPGKKQGKGLGKKISGDNPPKNESNISSNGDSSDKPEEASASEENSQGLLHRKKPTEKQKDPMNETSTTSTPSENSSKNSSNSTRKYRFDVEELGPSSKENTPEEGQLKLRHRSKPKEKGEQSNNKPDEKLQNRGMMGDREDYPPEDQLRPSGGKKAYLPGHESLHMDNDDDSDSTEAVSILKVKLRRRKNSTREIPPPAGRRKKSLFHKINNGPSTTSSSSINKAVKRSTHNRFGVFPMFNFG